MMLRSLFFLLVGLLLGACATDIPQPVREKPAQELRVSLVQQAPEQFIGAGVRWGGEIISVENLADITRVEVLARELGGSGKPVVDSAADARFIAELPGFLDPADYLAGQRLTISGIIERMETRDVGAFPYRYPVVRADAFYRWPATDPEPRCDPWCDPYWGPWYHPYPWHYRHRHPHRW